MRIQFPNRGSAYLLILGTMIVVMFLMLFTLKRSTNSAKKIFLLEEHLRAQNLLDSCKTIGYHFVVNYPFDKKMQLELPTNRFEIKDGYCELTLKEQDGYYLDFEIEASFESILKKENMWMRGVANSRGIQWKVLRNQDEF